MALVLFLTCLLLVLLIGECWLLFSILSQQGRLLLRLEAVEARQSEARIVPQAESGAPSGQEVAPFSSASAPGIGELAPDFSLPDLLGDPVKLSDFRGKSTLVLFWRPSCGFCRRMLADLKAWEANRAEDAPNLIVVSSESVADNQALGLRSPVVLDHTPMRVGSQFGATGTPMAMLVDGEGKIASELAAGVPAVLALTVGVQDRLTSV